MANTVQTGQAKVESRPSRPALQERGSTKELTSREKVSMQGDRPATPKPFAPTPAANAPLGSRTDSPRPPLTASRLGAAPHGLPTRPDVPMPGRNLRQSQIPDRPPIPRDSRDPRDSVPTRDVKEIREPRRDPRELAREPREPRDPTRLERRDVHDADRRAIESMTREAGRLSERDSSNRSETSARRAEPSHERDSRPSRDRQISGRDSRGSREHVAPSSQPQLPVARSAPPAEPPINPHRAALLEADDKPEIANSHRAALMQEPRTAHSGWSPRDAGRERTSSRASSPRRDDKTVHISSESHGREERHGRRSGTAAEPLPQFPRLTEQPRDLGHLSGERSRDTSHQGPSTLSQSNRSRTSQQDPNFGRLSGNSAMDNAPQSFRGRGSRSSASTSSMPTAPRSDTQMPPPEIPRAPSPARQPPTEPSSARGRRTQPSQLDQSQVGGEGLPTSSIGMHPDRIRQFESIGQIAPPPPPPPSGGPSSRARSNLPPIHTNDRVQTPTGPSTLRHGPGSLPNTPVRESSAPQSAPTGPAAAQDRHNKSGARRQLSAIQSSLAANRRDDGRNKRLSMPDSDAQILTGASPVSTPVQERLDPIRRNPMPDFAQVGIDDSAIRSREASRSGAPTEDFSTNRLGESDRGGRREHRDRGERSSRHGGRERSPRGERDPRDPRGIDNRERHDRRPPLPPGLNDFNRDRDPNLEPIQPRRVARDPMTNSTARDTVPSVGREPSMSGRDLRHRGSGDVRADNGRGENGRLDGANSGRFGEEWRGGRGGSMRGLPREAREGPRDGGMGRLGGEDRRESRGDDRTTSRKRRSDANEMPPNDRDKKSRR